MANDLVTRLLLNSNQFDNNLRNSARQVQNFQKMTNVASKGVTSGFNSIIGIAGKIAPQIGIAVGAFEVFNKTIHATQGTADMFDSAIAQASSAVDSFFVSLSRGDFSGFLSGLDDVITKAREAYEAIDELGSYGARYNPYKNALNSQIQTLMQQAKAAKAKGDIEESNQLLQQAKALQNTLDETIRVYGSKEADAGFKSLRSLMKEQDSTLGVSDARLKQLSDPARWKKTKQEADNYKKTLDEISKLESKKGKYYGGVVGKEGHYGLTTEEQNRLNDLRKQARANTAGRSAYAYLNLDDSMDTDKGKQFNTATANIYGKEVAEAEIEGYNARWDIQDAKTNKQGGHGGTHTPKVPTGESWSPIAMGDMQGINTNALDPTRLEYYTDRVARLKKQLNDPTLTSVKYAEIKVKLDKAEEDLEKFKTNSFGKFDIPPIKFDVQTNDPLEEVRDNLKDTLDVLNNLGNAFTNVGQAIDGTTGSVLEMAGATMQAIAQIIPQIVSLIGVQEAEALAAGTASGAGLPFPANIAAIASIIATITALFATFAGKFADGGIVGGSSYSGDKLWARVNSGEMILNKGQQANLSNMLGQPIQANGMGGTVHFKVQGKDLVGVLNNYNNKINKVR